MALRSTATTRLDEATRHEGFLRHAHFKFLKWGVSLSLVALVAYLFIDVTPRHNGGSWYGYTLGTIATLLIVWLTLLGVRKRAMTSGRWSLKAWTSAHVYLGLSLIFIGTLHTGFQLGWNVHTLAWALMMIVIGSGAWGIVNYARLPQQLSANRTEATQGQMLESIRTLDRQLHETAQPLEGKYSDLVRHSLENCDIGGGLRRRLTGRYPDCGNRVALVAMREEIREKGKEQTAHLAQLAFLLERKEAALTQARRHVRLKTYLEIWLYVHVPATFALLAALAAHIVSVFFYW